MTAFAIQGFMSSALVRLTSWLPRQPGLKFGEVQEPAHDLYCYCGRLYPWLPNENRSEACSNRHGCDDHVLSWLLHCTATLAEPGVCDDGHHGQYRVGGEVLATFVGMKTTQIDLAPLRDAWGYQARIEIDA